MGMDANSTKESSKDPNVFEKIIPKVVQTVRSSSALAAQDVTFYKSLDADINLRLDASGQELLNLINSVLKSISNEATQLEYGKDKIISEFSWKPVSDTLDNVFEEVDFLLDQASKKGKKAQNQMTYLEDGISKSNDRSEESVKIDKPQLLFRNKVNNAEEHPFKPKITSKPNALKPFEESVKLLVPSESTVNSLGEELLDPPYYPHPYIYEINNQPYPKDVLKKSEPIPSQDWSSTSAIWVDTKEKLQEMILELKNASEIAVDLEHHDYRTYYGLVCLMQISNRTQDWIVDTLALRDDLEPLNVVFTDPQIVKIFHGAFMDIIWLQRDLGLYIVSLFDTYHASKKLGFPKFSLAYLLETYAKFKTSKKYQLADWRMRPLLEPMMAYARSDTHFLLNIYDQLRNKLLDAGGESLQEVLYESRQVAKRRFEYTNFRPVQPSKSNDVSCPTMSSNPKEPYKSIMDQYNVPFERKPVVGALYSWRDQVAREHDESVRFVLSNQALVHLSMLKAPVLPTSVLSASNHTGNFVRQSAKELSVLIQETIDRCAAAELSEAPTDSNVAEEENFTTENGDMDLDKIRDAEAVFELLNKEFVGEMQLMKNDSVLLSKVLETESTFSIEYDLKRQKKIEHDSDVYADRQNLLHQELSKHTVEEKSNPPSIITPEEPVQTTIADEKIPEKDPKVFEDLDVNEVITIKNKAPRKPQTHKESAKVDAFDYASADKIMLDSKDRRGKNRNEKKRSFDPYGNNSSDGPRGAKKARKINMNKTTTYKGNKR